MKVAGNKLMHLRDFYLEALSPLMERSEIEAQFALASEHYLGIKKHELHSKFNENLNQSDLLLMYDCGKAIKQNIPIQYILGEAYFYGLTFKVNDSVLIPRPETEELVELILKENTKPKSILDIGTGSGCIPIALKKNLPTCNVSACDISLDALKVAKQNALDNAVDVHFFECDILSQDSIHLSNKQFDLIVSNPPYILDTEKQIMQAQVLEHEPHLALFVKGSDAIIFYRKIIELCLSHLTSGGKLFFELNPFTAEEVKSFALEQNYFSSVDIINDMSGKKRFLKAIKK